MTDQLLFEGSDWTFEKMQKTQEAIEEIARDDLGLDWYTNQIEIVSSEQMIDAYVSHGLPLMYQHWSFGKHFLSHEARYQKGVQGLAYELVINSDPCISYCMEDNTMALQALVMAHAAYGHNHFFKNNYLFRQWTDPVGLLEYLEYARDYIGECEEKYGARTVEQLLDSAHALKSVSMFRYLRKGEEWSHEKEARKHERIKEQERSAHYLWDTLPKQGPTPDNEDANDRRKKQLHLPEENILYFIENYSPKLESWEREILQIVRTIEQYFYPQRQVQIMNEGCASFVHYYIMNRLHEDGMIDDGTMLEVIHNHTNVVTQPDFDDPRYNGINPYTLGFSMMQDIKRICTKPTAEDQEWFPEIAGYEDWRNVLKGAWANYRDESFIQQFLSPAVIRKLHLFSLVDNEDDSFYTVGHIHDDEGYREVRSVLARTRDISLMMPDIQVIDVDLLEDRVLHIACRQNKSEVPLDESTMQKTLRHVANLWGYDTVLHIHAYDGEELDTVTTSRSKKTERSVNSNNTSIIVP